MNRKELIEQLRDNLETIHNNIKIAEERIMELNRQELETMQKIRKLEKKDL